MPNHSFATLVDSALDRAERTTEAVSGRRVPLPCAGFHELDQLTGGLQPGQLTVVASRPSTGRTTLLASVVRFNAVFGKVPTSFFTLEESGAKFATRIVSAEARVGYYALEHGKLDADDRERIAEALGKIRSAPLRVHADAQLTMAQVAAKARRDVEDRGAKLVVVDGLNDIKPEKANDLREREVGDVVRGLKTLARELDVPVLASAHLNRAPEQRFGRLPMLDDLRESGAVTFEADVIVLMHRPDLTDPESPRSGETDLIVAKNRYGVLATVTVAHQFHYARTVGMGF